MKRKNTVFPSARGLCLAAMMTALSVVIGIFCKSLLNFGGGLFRITFENIPIILSGILFGPVIGSLVGVASDLLSYLLSPQVYPPNLIVTAGAAAVGAISGLASFLMPKRSYTARITAGGALGHVLGSMVIKPIGLYQFYGLLVLWRIPMYLVIAPLEILFLIWLFRRKSFTHLIQKL